MPAGRNPAPGSQGIDPGRGDEPGPRTAASRLCRGDLGPPGPGAARRARGRLPRRARLRRRGFRHRPHDVERALAAHPSGPGRHRPRRGTAGARQTAADPGRRRHPPVARLRSAAGLRRGAVDPGRAHDERQGRHRLHPPALDRALRPLFADFERIDRGLGLPAGRRLQARRDRNQALCAAAGSDFADTSRHRRRGDRAVPSGRRGIVGRRQVRARGPGRSARRRVPKDAGGARRLCRRNPDADGSVARGGGAATGIRANGRSTWPGSAGS